MKYDDVKKYILTNLPIKINIKECNHSNNESYIDSFNSIPIRYRISINVDYIRSLINDVSNFVTITNHDIIGHIITGTHNGEYIESTYTKSIYLPRYGKYYIDPVSLNDSMDSNILNIDIYDEFTIYSNGLVSFNNFSKRIIGNDNISIPDRIDINTAHLMDKLKVNRYKYSSIGETMYIHDDNINNETTMNNIIIKDLSIRSYKSITIPENILEFSIEENNIIVGGLNIDDFIELYKNISENGITDPLMINIDNGLMYPLLKEDSILLLIANILKLPTIPVIIYTSDILKDDYMEYCKYINITKKYSSFKYLASELSPHLLLIDKKNINDSSIYIDNKLYNIDSYSLISSKNDFTDNYRLYSYKGICDTDDEYSINAAISYDIDDDMINDLISKF